MFVVEKFYISNEITARNIFRSGRDFLNTEDRNNFRGTLRLRPTLYELLESCKIQEVVDKDKTLGSDSKKEK